MDRDERKRTSSRREWLLAVLLAAAAVLIRLPHLGWGLPDIEEEAVPLKKAFQMWGWNEGRLQLDPQTAGWPSLSFYIHLLAQKLHYFCGRLFGIFADRYDYYLLQADWRSLVLLARSLGVAAVAGVVVVGVRLGTRLAGKAGAILVGLALVFSPLLVRHAQLITPDILQVFFAALALLKCVDVFERGRVRDHVWAGVWIGLGMACKYTPVLMALPLLVAHWLCVGREKRRYAWLGLADRRPWLAALSCALAFGLASPYVVAELGTLQRDLAYQVLHMEQGHFGQEGRRLGFLFYLRDVLPEAFGWPGLVLAVSGLAWAAWRSRGAWLIMAAAVAAFYGILGALSTQFDRYMLPLVLPLALGLAGFWLMLRDRLGGSNAMVHRASLALLLILVLVPSGLATGRYLQRQGQTSTLQMARQYIETTLGDQGHSYVMEAYCPDLPRDRRVQLQREAVFGRLSASEQQRLVGQRAYQIVYLPIYSTRVELSALYYDLRHFRNYDVIVTSDAVRGRYLGNPSRFPRQVRFYQDLDEYAELLRVFRTEDAGRGPEIRIYRFTGAGKERLVRERGPLARGFQEEFLGRLHAPHLYSFCRSLAQQAMAEDDFMGADLYYQTLYDSADDRQRVSMLPELAMAKIKSRQWEPARRLYAQLAAREPNNAGFAGMLGLALQNIGDLAAAEQQYARCLELGRQGRADEALLSWVRRQQESLRGETPPH